MLTARAEIKIASVRVTAPYRPHGPAQALCVTNTFSKHWSNEHLSGRAREASCPGRAWDVEENQTEHLACKRKAAGLRERSRAPNKGTALEPLCPKERFEVN